MHPGRRCGHEANAKHQLKTKIKVEMEIFKEGDLVMCKNGKTKVFCQ